MAVVEQRLGVLGRRRCLVEQRERLGDERDARAGGRRAAEEHVADAAEPRGALADHRRDRGIGVTGEPAARLLGQHPGALRVAGQVPCVYGPDVPPRQIRTGVALVEIDRPLPVRRCLGVAGDPLGGSGRGEPGPELLRTPARGRPVIGGLAGQRLAAGLQHGGEALVQPAPLTGQQVGGRRLGQQRVPGPVPAVGGGLRERSALQLPQARAQRFGVQSGHVGQLILGQRPPGHRHRGQRGPGLRTAVADPGGQQFRQPGRQPATPPLTGPLQLAAGAGQRLGDQLLGEERVALAASVQLVHVHGRLTAGQPGGLLGHLVAGQRRQPDLPRVPAASRVGQPAAHGRFQRRLVTADGRHHGDGVRAPRPRQEGQEVQGSGVGPVQVLDHHGEPGPPGHRGQQFGDPGENALALAAH